MNPEQFWDMEPREFQYAVKGYNKVQEDALQGEWERTRWLATTLVNLQTTKPVKAKDLLPLPWDKAEVRNTEAPTPEQIEAIKAKFNLE